MISTFQGIFGSVVKSIESDPIGLLDIDWGARAYRNREVMTPYQGDENLLGWEPRKTLPQFLNPIEEK